MIIIHIKWDLPIGNRPDSERRKDAFWQKYRLELFRKYTLASLQRQTFQDWTIWLNCDPELRRFTEDIPIKLNEPRIEIVYDISKELKAQNSKLKTNEVIRIARIDSDDMLHPQALEKWNAETEPGLYQLGDGFAFDPNTGRLFEWNHYSAAFICRVGGPELLDMSIGEILGGNHGYVYKKSVRYTDKRYYTVLIHGDNICNSIKCRWIGSDFSGLEKADILNEFGVVMKDKESLQAAVCGKDKL